jgi:ammonia channel protein AmtB
MSGRKGKESAPIGAVAKTVFWSFFGVRRRAHHEDETVRIKPVHVIMAGIIGAAVFVAVLVVLARLVVGTAAG